MAYKTYNTPIQGTSAYHLRIGYKVLEQNQEANTSHISYKLEIVHSDTSQRAFFNNVGDASTWFKVLGTTMAENKSFKYDFRRQSKILALEGGAIIYHRPSGVANVELQAYFDPALDGTGAPLKATTATVLVELPKLPGRAREFTLEKSTVDIGQHFTVKVTNPTEGYSYRCEIVHDNKSYPLSATTHTSFNIGTSNDLLNRLADRTSAPVTVRMTTISGGKELGTTSKQATVTVPASLRPSIKSVKVQNSTSAHVAFFNSSVHFLGEQSTAKIQITPNSETHGARVVEYEARVVDRHTKRATGTNAILSFKPFDFHRGGLKTYHIEGRIKDSRGRYSDWVESEALYAIEYKSPRLESIKVTREGSGTNAIVSRSYEVVELDIGEGPLNSAELTFYTRGVRADNWTKNAGAGSRSFELKNSEALLSGTFLATEGYEIKAVLKDHFSEVSTIVVLGTEAVPLDISKDGIGVGKMHEQGGGALQVRSSGGTPAVEVAGDLVVREGAILVPHGSGVAPLGRIHDTRSVNSPPEYYIENHPQQIATELKQTSVMGLPSDPGGSFVVVETMVPWKDGTAGGTQTVHGIHASFIRPLLYVGFWDGVRHHKWGDWRKMY